MKLRNLAPGQRVAIQERVMVHSKGKINTYELVIKIGKSKTKAVLLRSRVEKAIRPLFAEAS